MAAGAQTEVDKEVPTRALNDDDLFVRLQGWFKDDWDHHLEWVNGTDDEHKGAKEDFEFVAGRQWDEDALEILRKQNRPASVFDRVAPMIDAVCGYEVANRQEVRYIPREVGDTGVNELLTSAAMWFRDLSDAEDEESDSFRDATICGKGWTETRIDYEGNPDGDPIISRVNPLEICADRDACKPNLVDARRIWRVRRMSTDDALSLVPGADPSELHAGWASDQDLSVADVHRDNNDYDGNEYAKPPPECVIIECQWWEREPFVRFVDPASGQIEEMAEDQFNVMVERMSMLSPEQMMLTGIQLPVNPVTQYRRVYRRAFIGKTILAKPPMPVEGHFTYKCITGKRDLNRNHFTGLVKPMKDPARWTNKLFSQIMHILNSNAKGGLMVERGAIEDDRKFAQDYAKGDSIVYLNDGAIANNRIKEKPQAQFPQGHGQMLEFAMGAMPLVTGINQELLGMREANQPGVLEFQRKQAGLTILQTLFDSLRRYRKDQGRLMLRIIQEYLADGRIVKIAGKEGEKYIPLLRESTLGEYDVVVDDAPTTPNAKERNWAIIERMMPLLQPLFASNPQLAAEALRNSPLPESFINAVIEAMSQPPSPPDPEMEMAKRLGMAKQVADIQNKMAETEDSQANALGRKARALKDITSAAQTAAQAVPFVLNDIPSPPIPSLLQQAAPLAPQPQQMPIPPARMMGQPF